MIWKKLGKRFKMMLLIESNRLVPVFNNLKAEKWITESANFYPHLVLSACSFVEPFCCRRLGQFLQCLSGIKDSPGTK